MNLSEYIMEMTCCVRSAKALKYIQEIKNLKSLIAVINTAKIHSLLLRVPALKEIGLDLGKPYM